MTFIFLFVIMLSEREVRVMYKKIMLPNNDKGRALLEKIKSTGETIIITRKVHFFEIRIKVKKTTN